MKDIRENMIKEAREIEYRVAFIDTKDEDDMPYGISIFVPREYQKDFNSFLEKEEGNIFAHASNPSGSISY